MVASSVDPGDVAQDVALRDGTTVRVRLAHPDDLRRVEDYLIGLSDESRRLRFGSATVDVGEIARRVVSGNGDEHLAVLALHGGDDGTIVGGAQYFRLGGHRAEVSLSVADAYQGRGSARSSSRAWPRPPNMRASSASSPTWLPRTTA